MAYLKSFKRVAYIGPGSSNSLTVRNNVLLHQERRQLSSLTGVIKKARDTVLVLEATKGPVVKATCGVAQGVATAAAVVGTGACVTAVANLVNPSSKTSLALSSDEKMSPEVARRVGLTYFNTTNSLLMSSLTALISFRIFRNQAFLTRLGNQPLAAVGIGVVTPFLMASLVHHLPHTEDQDGILIPFGLKECGQLIHAGLVGLVAAPLYLLGGQSIFRAAYITAGLTGGLHGLSYVLPKDAFLNWGTPIQYAMHAVLVSFIMTLILRRDHVAFKPLYRFMMHGGLAVYSAHYLHTMQVIRHAAKSSVYDPVNASMSMSMDILNLYARLAFMLPPHFQLSHQNPIVKGRSEYHPHHRHPNRHNKENKTNDTSKNNVNSRNKNCPDDID